MLLSQDGFFMKLKSENPEVFYFTDQRNFLEKKDLENLIVLGKKSQRGRAKYCLHENSDSMLHEMFHVHYLNTYTRPHKQIDKSTSLHLISGNMDLYLFDDKGSVIDLVSLGDYKTELPFYFCAPKNTYRTLVVKSPVVLFHEIRLGPFDKQDTIFAPWAPMEEDHDGIRNFISYLTQ